MSVGFDNKSQFKKGVFFTASAYIMWGFLPIYWRLLSEINTIHILGFRILISLLTVGPLLLIQKNFSWFKFYKDKKTRIIMILASFFITLNWGLFIWAVNDGRTIETSIGYYITPILSILFGLILYKEKLKALQ
jgi:chloramphenicol-sensitive protein RarD